MMLSFHYQTMNAFSLSLCMDETSITVNNILNDVGKLDLSNFALAPSLSLSLSLLRRALQPLLFPFIYLSNIHIYIHI